MEENLTLSRGFDDISYVFPRQPSPTPTVSVEEATPPSKAITSPTKRQSKNLTPKRVTRQTEMPVRPSAIYPFACKICPRPTTYKMLSALVTHLAKIHNLFFNLEHPHKCTLCKMRIFKTKTLLLRHFAKIHPSMLAATKQEIQTQLEQDVEELMQITLSSENTTVVQEAGPKFLPSTATLLSDELLNQDQAILEEIVQMEELLPNSMEMEVSFQDENILASDLSLLEELPTETLLDSSNSSDSFFDQENLFLTDDEEDNEVFESPVTQVWSSFVSVGIPSPDALKAGRELDMLVAKLAKTGTSLVSIVSNEKWEERAQEKDRLDVFPLLDTEITPEKMVLRSHKRRSSNIENDSPKINVQELPKKWCKFCNKKFINEVHHLKERVCARCKFISQCANQHSKHLCFYK